GHQCPFGDMRPSWGTADWIILHVIGVGCGTGCGTGDGAEGADEEPEPPQPASPWASTRRPIPGSTLRLSDRDVASLGDSRRPAWPRNQCQDLLSRSIR